MYTSKISRRYDTRDLTVIGLFVAFMTICSWIRIPTAIPFTMQTFAVFFAALVLGREKSTMVVLSYILLGMMGVPVFNGFGAGIGVLFGVTGGYIIGFLLLTWISGTIIKNFGRKTPMVMMALFMGLLSCYLFGTLWFLFFYAEETMSFFAVFSICVFPFVVPDCMKILLAIWMEKKIHRYLPHSTFFDKA